MVEQVTKAEARGKRAFTLVVMIVIPIYGSPRSTHSVLFIVRLSVDGRRRSLRFLVVHFLEIYTQTFSRQEFTGTVWHNETERAIFLRNKLSQVNKYPEKVFIHLQFFFRFTIGCRFLEVDSGSGR